MNELIIMGIMCTVFLGGLTVFIPIYYLLYKWAGGEKNFWEFLWEI